MIKITSRLKKYALPSKQIKALVQKMLDELDYSDFDLSIWFTNNKTIRFYNKNYRNKDKATDILSFPHHPGLKAGQRIKVLSDDDKALGDLIISVEYTEKDAIKFGVSLNERINLLLAHGIAHLLGHDHIKDSEFRVMRRLEQRLLRAIAAF